MPNFKIDEGDVETDALMLCGIEQNFEVRNTQGDEPGRTVRLDRMEREGLITKTYWYDITEKGRELMRKQFPERAEPQTKGESDESET